MDTISKHKRSLNMSKIKASDTKPEMIVRKYIYSEGFRYRIHRKDLPGTPDIVFTKEKKIIFVNGCFWHRHNCKSGQFVPKTNKVFWEDKFSKNVQNDIKNVKLLTDLGFSVLKIWECDIKNNSHKQLLDQFLV